MSSDLAIEARDLTKVYKLYQRPQDKLLDMLGLLRGRRAFTEHHALDGVTIEIAKGEKVGIIGRNGAGKSTLLKLVSGVIEPTSGTLRIAGSARALLEIGTGFHPDFTGRENVRAYLAQLAMSTRQVEALLPDVIEFAEIEEYIDQPLKTYSTGMKARLMFATSTVVTPELLILDEVLGVGDAYFTRKSFDRIQEMCERDRSTLLLVSHDIYSTSRIAERMIWLERGRVVFDGEPHAAVAAYEESIREQEEHRLRRKALMAVQRAGDDDGPDALHIEISPASHQLLPGPVYFGCIALLAEGEMVAELPLITDGPGHAGDSCLLDDQSCWGGPTEWRGRCARPMWHHGSPFRKVAGLLVGQGLAQRLSHGLLDLLIEQGSDSPVQLQARIYVDGRHMATVVLPCTGNGWQTHQLEVTPGLPLPSRGLRSFGFGTGRVSIDKVTLLAGERRETLLLTHGEPAVVEVNYTVRDVSLSEQCDVVIAVLRNGVDSVCRFFTRELLFDFATQERGTLVLVIDSVRFGVGEYSISVKIAREGYHDRSDQPFYSIGPDMYCCVRDALFFSVGSDSILAQGTAIVGDATWSIRSRS